MIRRLAIPLVLVAALAAGCGTVATRDTSTLTTEQRTAVASSEALASAYVSVTQTRALALDLLASGSITPDQAQRAQGALDDARVALDGLRVMLAAATPPPPGAKDDAMRRATAAIAAARSLLTPTKATP